MGEIICRIKRKREEGYLYYIAFDKEGYLLVGKAKLQRHGRKRVRTVKKEA